MDNATYDAYRRIIAHDMTRYYDFSIEEGRELYNLMSDNDQIPPHMSVYEDWGHVYICPSAAARDKLVSMLDTEVSMMERQARAKRDIIAEIRSTLL